MKLVFLVGVVWGLILLSACMHGGVQGSSGSGAAVSLEGKVSLPFGK